MKKEIQDVYDWADSKDLRDNSTAKDQFMKLDEEAGNFGEQYALMIDQQLRMN